jgi:hypothetical protein
MFRFWVLSVQSHSRQTVTAELNGGESGITGDRIGDASWHD